MFWKRKNTAQAPAVELFELVTDGAAFSWNSHDARAIALEMFIELARRLEGAARIERLRLSGDIGTPIDVPDVTSFVRLAPDLVKNLYRFYEFEFRLNEGSRVYRIRHLDQSTSGMFFQTPVDGEAFWDALGAVMTEYGKREETRVRISTGPWFRDH